MAKSKQALAAVDSPHAGGSLAAIFSISSDASAEELLDLGVQELNRSGYHMARAGACFLAFRNVAKKNELPTTLAERGIPKDHFYRAIQYAEYLDGLPEADARRLSLVPYTKVLAIAKADPEVVAELLEEGALDGDEPLSVRELRARLKKAESRAQKSDTRAEAIQGEFDKLKFELAHRHDHLQMPAFAAESREEAAALTEKMLACVESLARLCEKNLLNVRDEPEGERFQRMAAGTLYHALIPVVARSGEVLRMIEQAHGTDVTAGVKFDHQLTPRESAHYSKMRVALLELHEKQAKNREAVRENNKGGKGRPRHIDTEAGV